MKNPVHINMRQISDDIGPEIFRNSNFNKDITDIESMDTPKDVTFQSRANLNRTLEFRPHLKFFTYVIAALFLISEALVYLFFTLIEQDSFQADHRMLPVAVMILVAVYFAFLAYLARGVSLTKVQVMPNLISIVKSNRKIDLPFSEIQSLDFSFVPYIGGWFQLNMKDGLKHRFSVVLERSEYLLESIVSQRPELAKTELVLKYRRTAIYSDHSWTRLYGKFKSWKKDLLIAVGLAVTFAVAVKLERLLYSHKEDSLSSIINHLALGLFIVGFSAVSKNLAAEIHFAKTFRKDSLENPNLVIRDVTSENQALRAYNVVFWIVFIAASAGVILSMS